MNVCITGSSHGLGAAFATHFHTCADSVFGLGRSAVDVPYAYERVDMSDFNALNDSLKSLFSGVHSIELLLLNAGTLGRIEDISACDMAQLKYEMDVNMWSNKVILDFFIAQKIELQQVVAISSGASVNGSLGWNGYSLSKAALNMLIKLYAAELPQTHCCALAPGLVQTQMLDGIIDGDHDTKRYSSVARLKQSRDEGLVLDADATVNLIMRKMPEILAQPSGAFVDIRSL